eukprot:195943-Rhodomonas_salina.2
MRLHLVWDVLGKLAFFAALLASCPLACGSHVLQDERSLSGHARPGVRVCAVLKRQDVVPPHNLAVPVAEACTARVLRFICFRASAHTKALRRSLFAIYIMP